MIGAMLRARTAALFAALSGAASPATAQGRVWDYRFDAGEPPMAYLGYGVPETDDTLGGFHCEAHSGAVTVFISETDGKQKAGKAATAIFAVGETQTKIAGKLAPNEEAGVPSFEGRIAADDPIFAAMARGDKLVVTIGGSKQSAPLNGVAGKVEKFVEACRKK
ncbi:MULTISPECIES: hypothetical protein [Methylosinus]|nr:MULTISPECIES: hypothetical protein [Methylosinus]